MLFPDVDDRYACAGVAFAHKGVARQFHAIEQFPPQYPVLYVRFGAVAEYFGSIGAEMPMSCSMAAS